MEDHAYSFYCKDKYWERCEDENLEVVKVFDERFYDDGDLAHRITIYRCRVCGGFYKHQYRAVDTDEGWSITDDYFRIEEPRYKTPGSSLDVPLTIDEARTYGYAGEDRSWKNGRCNFPVQNVELTCRAGDLQFVVDVKATSAWDHLNNKFYKCRRCGEWYLFTPLPPHPQGLLKPTNELFPLELARAYGYEEVSKTENEEVPKTENESSEAPPDIDALTQQAIRTDTLEDWDALLREIFALPEWIFIARGVVPKLYPYSAPRASGGELLTRGFTDRERAIWFARANELTDADGSCVTLGIPTADVVKHLENHPLGRIEGVWFNSGNRDNPGFLVSLEQMRRLAGRFSKATPDRKQSVKTLQVIVQEALVLTPEFVRETPYKINFFCRVPGDWVENGELKAEFWKKIADRIFGEDWSAETFPIGHYIIKSSETEILDDRHVAFKNWRDMVETGDNLYYFFIGSGDGEAVKVTAPEFQKDVNDYFQAPEEEPSDVNDPDNLNELDASLVAAWYEPEKLPAVGEWLRQSRGEMSHAQYAYIVLKKHFAREKLRLRKDDLPGSWRSMGRALNLNIDAFVREQKRAEMLKAMFAELVDFCEAASGEYFAYRLKELLENSIESRAHRYKITPLLPAKALEKFAEIDRMLDEEHQDYIDRLNQMGY